MTIYSSSNEIAVSKLTVISTGKVSQGYYFFGTVMRKNFILGIATYNYCNTGNEIEYTTCNSGIVINRITFPELQLRKIAIQEMTSRT
jgi:hypothetical protein